MDLFGSLKWIDSYGGPFLLLEERLLDQWRGVHVKNSQVLESDYDRACDIEDYVGLVAVGSDFGIVLGDEPLMTIWYSLEPNKGLIVRWGYAENEASVITALAKLKFLPEIIKYKRVIISRTLKLIYYFIVSFSFSLIGQSNRFAFLEQVQERL